MCADEFFSNLKSDHVVWGLATAFLLIKIKDKEPRFVMPEQHQMVKRGKKDQTPLFLASLFLLSCTSLGRLMDKKQGGRNACSVQSIVPLSENTESNLVLKKESETIYFYKVR